MTLLVHPLEQNQQQQGQDGSTESIAVAAVDLNSKAVVVVPDPVSDYNQIGNNSSMPTATTHNAARDADNNNSTYADYHETPVPTSTLSSTVSSTAALQQSQPQYDATTNRSHQQRAYSVTAMPTELLQKTYSNRKGQSMQEDAASMGEQRRYPSQYHDNTQPRPHTHQPWWQYYYQLYHYSLPPGRKPTVFGPYLLLQTLGEGEFGKVKFGIEIKTGQEVAIKLIRKDSIDSASRMTKVEREISVLRVLHHPNIVELFDVIETEKYIGIILQCATGGELFDYILAHRYLKEKDASRLFAQLISGVNYMHRKHIVHRDLKLENLLLDRHRNVLITDFGFANQFASAQDDLMSTSCGSPCYAAPELVMNQQGLYVGPAVDIWSCGVILFAMLCGYLPYDDDPANPESYNINLLYKYILNTPLVFPDYISEEACDLMSLMLVPDPEKRCTMETIMAHPWLGAHRHLFVIQSDEEEEEEEEEGMEVIEQERHVQEEAEEEEDQTMITSSLSTTKQEKTEENIAAVRIGTIKETSNDTVKDEHAVPESEDEDAVVPSSSSVTEHKREEDQSPETKITIAVAQSSVATNSNRITKDIEGSGQEKATKDENLLTTPSASTAPTSSNVGNAICTDPNMKDIQREKQSTITVKSRDVNSATDQQHNHEKVRAKSTASSAEKVLHFLSGGHSSTFKSAEVARDSNTNNDDVNTKKKNEKKRTRHMSLVTENTTIATANKENHYAESSTAAAAAATSSTSILHSKFLSSVVTNHDQKRPHYSAAKVIASALPNFSLSTPHSTNKSTTASILDSPHKPTRAPSTTKKRNIRLSNNLTRPNFTSATPPPPSSEKRGTRRKTLSLLVNSMTENHKNPFSSYRRQSNNIHHHQQVSQQNTTAAEVAVEDAKTGAITDARDANENEQPRVVPSISENTTNSANKKTATSANNTTTNATKAEKHRSAGKKLMDWFKKKPLNSAHQKAMDHPAAISNSEHKHQPATAYDTHPNRLTMNMHHHHHHHKEPIIKLRTHHGAVDQEALTSRPPQQVFQDVKAALQSLGLVFKRDGSNDFKLKCSRPKSSKKKSISNHHNEQRRFSPQHGISVAHNTTPPPPRMSMLHTHLHKNTSHHLTNSSAPSSSGSQQQNGIRSLLRRTSAQQQPSSTSSISSSENIEQREHDEKAEQKKASTVKPIYSISSSARNATRDETVAMPPIYGDPNVDPGEEIRFSIELCKIKNLPGLYIVDMRRLRGNVWAYKFIYRTLMDTLKLGGKDGYLNTTATGTASKSSVSAKAPVVDDTNNSTNKEKGEDAQHQHQKQRCGTEEEKGSQELISSTDNSVTVSS